LGGVYNAFPDALAEFGEGKGRERETGRETGPDWWRESCCFLALRGDRRPLFSSCVCVCVCGQRGWSITSEGNSERDHAVNYGVNQ